MPIKEVAGVEDRDQELGLMVQHEEWWAVGSVQLPNWTAIHLAAVPCRVRSVAILPRAAYQADSTNYWMGHLAVSRLLDQNPVTLPAAGANPKLIASRVLNNYSDGFFVNKSWSWSSVTWNDANTEMLPGDVLGVYWEKFGAPANIPAPQIYVARLMPVRVT